MTLSIIIIGAILVCVILIKADKKNMGLGYTLGVGMCAFFICMFLLNLAYWYTSYTDSTIKYQQIIQQEEAISAMLSTAQDTEQGLFNQVIIEYNSTVINEKFKSQSFIYRDYYNQALDWQGLKVFARERN